MFWRGNAAVYAKRESLAHGLGPAHILHMARVESGWLSQIPQFGGLESDAARALRAGARLATYPVGTVLFREGEPCDNFLLLLQGRIRVQKVSAAGREIVLYRVESGESCILTTSCLMAGEAYSAEGVAETEVRAAIVGDALFHDILGRSTVFRRFVFGACGQRLAGLLCLLQEVAFGRIDVRLSQILLDMSEGDGVVHTTHQALAVELGSAREVISRQLKDFERKGWVRLGRGAVAVLDPHALEALGDPRRAL